MQANMTTTMYRTPYSSSLPSVAAARAGGTWAPPTGMWAPELAQEGPQTTRRGVAPRAAAYGKRGGQCAKSQPRSSYYPAMAAPVVGEQMFEEDVEEEMVALPGRPDERLAVRRVCETEQQPGMPPAQRCMRQFWDPVVQQWVEWNALSPAIQSEFGEWLAAQRNTAAAGGRLSMSAVGVGYPTR